MNYINKHITREEALRSVGAGWSELIHEAYDIFENDGTVNVIQVKEKFGGLRIYFDGGHESILNMTDELEQRSFYICEECGEPGFLRNKRWMKTLCDKHCDGAPPLLHGRNEYGSPLWHQSQQLDLFGRENNGYF